MYRFYIDDILLPIAPKSMNTKYPDRNETIDLADGREFNLINPVGLTEYAFTFELPAFLDKYPFAHQETPTLHFTQGWELFRYLRQLKTDGDVVVFKVLRCIGSNDQPFDELREDRIAIGTLDTGEDAVDLGKDFSVNISLKVTPDIGNLKLDNLEIKDNKATGTINQERDITVAKGWQTYVVQKGDSPNEIARKLYGTASAWTQIYQANKEAIDKRAEKDGMPKGYLAAGQVLQIPPYARPVTQKKATNNKPKPKAKETVKVQPNAALQTLVNNDKKGNLDWAYKNPLGWQLPNAGSLIRK